MAISTEVDLRTFTGARNHFDKDWKVMLYNDNSTSIEFVIDILCSIFDKPIEKSTELAISAHTYGYAFVAYYPKKLALVKVNQAMQRAKEYGYCDFKMEAKEEI